MTEEEFLDRWNQQRPTVEAWGKFVAARLMLDITPLVAPAKAEVFVRLPVIPRVKDDGSLITKAFYRDKNYTDPLNDITDKVGVRFVVLLPKAIAVVSQVIEKCAEWEWSKDKDFESEIEKAPYEFRYQSVHYVVRSRGRVVDGINVEAGTPCEIQVRTLLQHAHSELTHDTIYKPSVTQTPEMHRAAAKAMALIEATSDYFEELFELIEAGVQPNRSLSVRMASLYRELTGRDPAPTAAEGLLNDAYASFGGENAEGAVRNFMGQKPFVLDRIRERANGKLLFRQPSILLAYLAISARAGDAREAWPLTPAELKPIFTDLGIAHPAS
jgi:ppGpp synthetase/RelA/SpoT-type nucleotidyltranferase